MYTHPLAIGIRHTAHILQETSRKLPGSETGEDGNRVGLWRVEGEQALHALSTDNACMCKAIPLHAYCLVHAALLLLQLI